MTPAGRKASHSTRVPSRDRRTTRDSAPSVVIGSKAPARSGLPPYLARSRNRWSESQSDSNPRSSAARAWRPSVDHCNGVSSGTEKSYCASAKPICTDRDYGPPATRHVGTGSAPPYARVVIECVPNVSEGRSRELLTSLATACGDALLDVHADPDHHRSVFTLAGPGSFDAARAVRDLAVAVSRALDVRVHAGVHPRLGALDVVPFVALPGSTPAQAVDAARGFATWLAAELAVPVFLYDAADPSARDLPTVRRGRVSHVGSGSRAPGTSPHLGCDGRRCAPTARRRELRARPRRPRPRATSPGTCARATAACPASARSDSTSSTAVGCKCRSTSSTCTARDWSKHALRWTGSRARRGAHVERVELVGLVPRDVLERCSAEFRATTGIGDEQTIEARLAARGPASVRR